VCMLLGSVLLLIVVPPFYVTLLGRGAATGVAT
jgi:hypothetical protein